MTAMATAAGGEVENRAGRSYQRREPLHPGRGHGDPEVAVTEIVVGGVCHLLTDLVYLRLLKQRTLIRLAKQADSINREPDDDRIPAEMQQRP